eukprot:s21_g9.t1
MRLNFGSMETTIMRTLSFPEADPSMTMTMSMPSPSGSGEFEGGEERRAARRTRGAKHSDSKDKGGITDGDSVVVFPPEGEENPHVSACRRNMCFLCVGTKFMPAAAGRQDGRRRERIRDSHAEGVEAPPQSAPSGPGYTYFVTSSYPSPENPTLLQSPKHRDAGKAAGLPGKDAVSPDTSENSDVAQDIIEKEALAAQVPGEETLLRISL